MMSCCQPPPTARYVCVASPNTPEAVAAARKMIEKVVKEEMNEDGGVAFGIAGGACGSDLLFHEVCNALNIPTQLLLALPEAQFHGAAR
jgi:hypothetical protein